MPEQSWRRADWRVGEANTARKAGALRLRRQWLQAASSVRTCQHAGEARPSWRAIGDGAAMADASNYFHD